MTKHLPPEDPSAIDRAHGILPLITATHDAYAHKKSEKELIK